MKCLQFQQLKMKSRNFVAVFSNTEYLQKILTTLPIWKYHGNRETPLKKLLEMRKKSPAVSIPLSYRTHALFKIILCIHQPRQSLPAAPVEALWDVPRTTAYGLRPCASALEKTLPWDKGLWDSAPAVVNIVQATPRLPVLVYIQQQQQDDNSWYHIPAPFLTHCLTLDKSVHFLLPECWKDAALSLSFWVL